MEIKEIVGIHGKNEIIVTADKTAVFFGSGSVEVFATPAMITLMEQTAMESVASLLPEGSVSVGTEVNVKHFKATLPGKKVTCFSRVIQAEGRRIVFEVEAHDLTGLIGKGTHIRAIVDKKLFIDNLK